MNLGTLYTPGELVDFHFTSRSNTGVPTTLSGSPVLRVYKGNGTTESNTGITLTVDFDGVTGLNQVRIDTSASLAFYATGGQFSVVIGTGTVGGVSVVGEVVARFGLRGGPLLFGKITDSPTTTSFVDSSLTSGETDAYKGRVILFTSGNLRNVGTRVNTFTPGTDTITFEALPSAPTTGDEYVIV